MEVHIVYNEGLHHDSSYNAIIGVFHNIEDAKIVMGCEIKDFEEGISRGDFGDDFDKIEIDEDMFPINPKQWDECIVSTKGYYEAWRVETWQVK